MKPLSLSFSGIGPYPGRVEINFNELNPKGLYLIVGPTGAGKTTLFDAMAYALYGRVASDRASDIVSAYENRLPPEIEFTFSHGDRTYIVHRELATPSKPSIPSKQWLREFNLKGEELNTVTGAKAVSEKCSAVTGLNVDEFLQVILLPQGKFQRFLMATGSEKQKVLQTIFGTMIYRKVVDQLRETAEGLRAEVRRDEAIVGEQWAVIDANVQSLYNNAIFAALPDPHENINATVAFVAERLVELLALDKRARDALMNAKSFHTKAKLDTDRFDKFIQLQTLREQQKGDKKQIEMFKKKILAHDAAVPVVETAEAQKALVIELGVAQKSVLLARTSLKNAATQLKTSAGVTKAFIAAIEKASPAKLSSELAKLYGTLTDCDRAYKELSGIRKAINSNDVEQREHLSELRKLHEEHAKWRRSADQAKRDLKEARNKLKGLAAATSAVSQLEKLREKANVGGAKRTLIAASSGLRTALRRFEQADAKLQSALDLRAKELAGQLAAALVEDEACPVCGSTAHPRKAKSSSLTVNVEGAETSRDKAFGELTNAERNVKDAQKALSVAQEFEAKLPGVIVQKKILKKFHELTTIEESIDELEMNSNVESEHLANTRAAISEIERAAAVAVTEGSNLSKQRQQLQAQVSKVGQPQHVTNGLSVCKQLKNGVAELERFVTQSDMLKGEAQLAASNASAALGSSSFTTENAARAAFLDGDERTRLKKSVGAFDAIDLEIIKLNAAIGTEPVPKDRPDLDDLSERLQAAESASKELASHVTEIELASKQIDSARKVISTIEAAIEGKASNYRKAESIAAVFEKGAGGPSGQLSLEMWVQRTRFEEVCLVANTQLRELSANRYSLTLEQEEGGVAKSRGSGLDIYVLDSYTGYTRPVQSMSGGEQFIASLALALALAEVVQRHAGGIELPCLFIDEGFGSLDLESLDRAIEVLGKIHAAGRTVGIITHVETMQQQLPIGIRVNKTDQGSTLEVLTN
jgi:exonuclease SbcC